MLDSPKCTRECLAEADCLLINSGAGMEVDSGLPDFRGNEGFWKAYPPYKHLGFNFMEMANPERFVDAPELGWGFYGHRLNLYRETDPHAGFRKLLEFSKSLPHESFAFTSNVDGHFERAGFDKNNIVECHGSIRHFQCFRDCQGKIWNAPPDDIQIDLETMRAVEPLPRCPDCNGLARPNILMFGDYGWNSARTRAQEKRYQEWQVRSRDLRVVILEFGAGTAVPTVRYESEHVLSGFPNSTLIRVNPREAHGSPGTISIGMGALEMIEACL